MGREISTSTAHVAQTSFLGLRFLPVVAHTSFFRSAVLVRCSADLVLGSAALTRCCARLPTHLTNQRPKVRRAWARLVPFRFSNFDFRISSCFQFPVSSFPCGSSSDL